MDSKDRKYLTALLDFNNFLEAGGESFTMIPCLNVHPLWVKAIGSWVKTAPSMPPDPKGE